MTRAFLPAESQARYTDDQFAAIHALARIAREQACALVVVAGDVFDSIQPDRRIVSRAVDALADFDVPVYLLPGNHDADSPAALWSTSNIIERLPTNVTVIRDTAVLRIPGVRAEVVGAPWPSRKAERDLVASVLESLAPPEAGIVRIAVVHGATDLLARDEADPSLISLATLERAISDRLITYAALGDRHSMTSLGTSGSVWYSGAPLATDYREVAANKALIVDVDPVTWVLTVEPVEVGTWQFVTQTFNIDGLQGVATVESYLQTLLNKERTVVKLEFVGTVNLSTYAALEDVIDRSRDLFAALEESKSHQEFVVLADGADLSDLDLSGFAHEALVELVDAARGNEGAAEVARDSVMLLHRLAARAS
jgi:DNA repair exonuclease SbcCD nuclease subunit